MNDKDRDPSITWKRGDRFYHSRLLDPTKMPGKVPVLCQITRIAQGNIYFRTIHTYADPPQETLGSLMFCSLAYFPKVYASPMNQFNPDAHSL